MYRRLFVFLSTLLLAVLGFTTLARADAVNDDFVLSVKHGPLEIPGRVLTPGKYDLRFLDDEHKVLDVSTAAGEQIGLYEVMPISRATRKDNVQLLLSKPRPGQVTELTGFFYPETKTGYKFEYPRSEPMRMARASVPASSAGR